jgi:bifunctional NMN adenylyltransferase/nudix hydrolase
VKGNASVSPSLGLFIGRFQPFHLGHEFIVKEALERVDFLLIVIGSSTVPRSLKNPFSIEERVYLVEENLKFFLSPKDAKRVSVAAVPDFKDDESWTRAIAEVLAPFLLLYRIQKKVLVGHDKDQSTYYLRIFKDFELLLLKNFNQIDGTKIRNAYFGLEASQDVPGKEMWRTQCSPVTERFLDHFRRTSDWKTIIKGSSS